MEIQVGVLFKNDRYGRITKINEPLGLDAPLFFLGRTKEGNVLRFNANFPDSFKELIVNLNQDQANIDLAKLMMTLNKIKTINNIWIGPAYVFSEDFAMSSNAVKISKENIGILQKGFPNLINELEWRQPIFAIIEHGIAVSVCCSARKNVNAVEASVETLEGYQGKGYGTESVIAWARESRNAGLIPLYSTSWDNFSSQTIAKKLNLYRYGIDLHFS